MIGFASSTANKNPSYYPANPTWMFYLSQKNLYENGSASILFLLSQTTLSCKKDDILSICLDTENCKIYFKYNGLIASYKRKITIDNSIRDRIFPCIDMYATGQKVTIL